MKKRIYLAMLAACFALTASACGDSSAVITDNTKTETSSVDDKKAEVGTNRLVSVENVDKYITIGEYKGLTLDNTVDAITDDDVQVEKARKETGMTPFGILHEAGGFDCKVLIGHGLWIEEDDLKYLRDDTWFAFCPKTYMKLASGKGGFFDHYKKLNYGFGTDGAASSNTLNPMEQARLFGLLGKYQDRNSAEYTAEEIWKHLMASHQAFPFGSGRMKEGAPADLVIWDLYQPDTFPFYSPISSILYSSNSQNVKYTMVAGEFLKYDGKLKMDTEALMKEAIRLQKELLARGKGKAEVTY